jgi:hypothetical protein
MAEPCAMNKPTRYDPKQLRDVAGKIVGESFRRQGFASAELVTRWSEIAGAEVAASSPALWCCASKDRPRSRSSISPI